MYIVLYLNSTTFLRALCGERGAPNYYSCSTTFLFRMALNWGLGLGALPAEGDLPRRSLGERPGRQQRPAQVVGRGRALLQGLQHQPGAS